ncbi:MAG: PP2C family protein-serine/threonine phosphatase [Turicibacter sp.]
MKYFVDIASGSLNKSGEELCGDKVDFFREKNNVIVVLSDGLGSGVKANILATLTSKIAITMLKEGLSIDEVVDTIIHTLPMCQVRQLAYSTFTIVKVDDSDCVYAVEFDNPSLFFLRDGKISSIQSNERVVNGRKIKESIFKLEEGDTLVFTSDGVIHAGVGTVLNLGWSWPEVAKFLESVVDGEQSARDICQLLLQVCSDLYVGKPGDDTTVVCMKVIKPKVVTLFAGPPQESDRDSEVIKELMKSPGKKIVCGGTAANIVSREIGREIETSFDFYDPSVPPIAYIKGIDLVTEGVLTIKGAVEILKEVRLLSHMELLQQKHGAALLAKLLFEQSTHVNLLIGKAINPAHQNPDFPKELSIKLRVLEELQEELNLIGKIVEISYY